MPGDERARAASLLQPAAAQAGEIALESPWPFDVDDDWALGDSTGEGVRVCVLDSGVDGDHPDVGGVERSVAVEADDEGYAQVVDDDKGDMYGHGTACSGIIRSLAPDVEISSVRVLGKDNRGSGGAMVAGLQWAVEQGFDVINMSLSTTNKDLREYLHETADTAYFKRTLLVASAHNMAREELALDVLVGDLGGQPRRRRPARVLLQPLAARSSSTRAGWT